MLNDLCTAARLAELRQPREQVAKHSGRLYGMRKRRKKRAIDLSTRGYLEVHGVMGLAF
jgi:hypothetical protein